MSEIFAHVWGPIWYPKHVLNSDAIDEVTDGETSAQQLSERLRKAMLRLKAEHMSELGDKVDYDAISASDGFSSYVAVANKLRAVKLTALSEDERRAFFINIYNSLIIHAIVSGFVRKSYLGAMLARLFLYRTASYNIGGFVFTLDELEHGILRDNAFSIAENRRPFSDGDFRLNFIVRKDPRIHFALNCGAVSCPPIAAYSASRLNSELDIAARNYLESTKFDDSDPSVIILSKLFLWYRGDFGESDEEVLRWIAKHSSIEVSHKVTAALAHPPVRILYQEYIWGLNIL
jgi:hypothetical protein